MKKKLSIMFALVLTVSLLVVPVAVSANTTYTQAGSAIQVTSLHLCDPGGEDEEAFNAEPHETVVDAVAFDAQTCSQVVIEGEVSALTLGTGWVDTAYVEIGLRPESTKTERNAGVYLIAYNASTEDGTEVHLQDYTGMGYSLGVITLPDINTGFRYKITLEPSVDFGGTATLEVWVDEVSQGILIGFDYGFASTWDEGVAGALNEDFSEAHLFYSIIADRRGIADQPYSATVGAVTIDDTLYVGGGEQFPTIQAAIEFANPGDTISVATGTYNETVVVNKELTLEGAQPDVDPTVEGARTNPAEESTITGAVTIKASDIVVDGFRIEGTVYVDDSVSAITDATISNNIITGTSYGVRVGVASECAISQLTIEYNEIIGNVSKGICFWKVDWEAGNLHDVTIRGNTISDNGSTGISTYGAGPYFIIDNTVSGNAGNGISIKYDDGDVITGNIVEDNDAMGINMHQVTNCTVEDNTVSGHVAIGLTTTFWGTVDEVGNGSGIYLHEDSTGNTIRYNDLKGNANGVLIADEKELFDPPSANSITYNNIADNIYYGVLNALVDPPDIVDATYNWWGDETGPYHATLNPGVIANMGDAVSDNVDFSPWLYKTQETIVPPEEPAYAQSVVLDNTGEYAWNTFSTPIVLDDTADTWAKLIALTGLDYTIAYRFDPASDPPFVPLTTTDESPITPGEGLFIKMNTAGSLPILYSTAENLVPLSRLLTVGFNLIGLAWLEDMDVDDALFSLAGEVQVVSPTGNESPGPVLTGDTVYVGEAYWAYMLGEETLVGFTTTPVNWAP